MIVGTTCARNTQSTETCICPTAPQYTRACLLQVPDDAVLLAEESELQQYIADHGLYEEGDQVLQSLPLVLTVMFERMKGELSRWAAYLNFLPRDLPGMPFMWEVRAITPSNGVPWNHVIN
jgi:hypothetical protein